MALLSMSACPGKLRPLPFPLTLQGFRGRVQALQNLGSLYLKPSWGVSSESVARPSGELLLFCLWNTPLSARSLQRRALLAFLCPGFTALKA